MYTWGVSYMLCDCLFFEAWHFFIWAYEFVFMHVHLDACALCVCGSLILSIWPLRLSSGAPGVNVSQNPSLSRPPEALTRLCVSVCVYSVAGRGKHSLGESHYELRVREGSCVNVGVLITDQPGFFENYSSEEVNFEVLVCTRAYRAQFVCVCLCLYED